MSALLSLSRSATIIFYALVIIGASVVAQGARADTAEEARHLMVELNSADAKAASKAAEDLRGYPFAEVEAALFYAVQEQISSAKPNSYILNKALESLGQITPLANYESLNKFYENEFSTWVYNERLRGEKKAEHVDEAFTAALREIQRRQLAAALPLLYAGRKVADGLPTFDEMTLALTPQIQKNIHDDLLPGVEENIYDKSVSGFNDGTNAHYGGRDVEIEKITQALLRLDKSHVLLTGKAGVGKTTLLKMISNGWVEGRYLHPGGKVPITLELNITDVTNAADPTLIKKRVATAQLLAKALDRHVILFVDEAHISSPMTRNALKNFLTKEQDLGNRVHFIWATTSSESRNFLSDSAFSRRWVEVSVPEFTNKQAIEAIKLSYVPKWRKQHVKDGIAFQNISDDAFEYAARFSSFEQPHAGNPTGIKEMLEGAIIYKLHELHKKLKTNLAVAESERNFTLTPEDIRHYMGFQLGFKLIPGEKDFDQKFEAIWREFEADYVGNDAVKAVEHDRLKKFFGSLSHRTMEAQIQFGPPGAGKSYMPTLIAKHFFETKPLEINLAEYSEGGVALNKLIGSPTGTSGAEEQRSVLTKYIKDNPKGGVVVFEEVDFGHQDIFNFLVNTITSKKFQDGLGQDFNTERFIFIFNTNVGQELLIAKQGGGHVLTWDEIEMRRKAITSEVIIDGKSVPVVRPEITNQVFDEFFAKLSAKSNPNSDTSVAFQDGEKLKRRMVKLYVLPPSQKDLVKTAVNEVKRFSEETFLSHGVRISISDETVEQLLDLKNYRFEEGYGFVHTQLENRLYAHVNSYLDHRGETLAVSLGSETVKVGKKGISGLKLVVTVGGGSGEHSLGVATPQSRNPWFKNQEIMARIRNFPELISTRLKGQEEQIAKVGAMLKEKALNWSSRIVFTQIGTSGNGKTEFGYSAADVLFGSRSAAFKISGLNKWGDLNNYMRSDTGFSGSKEETAFEKWFKSRKSAGGGVIILDELLSFSGLSREEIAGKVEVINKLYDMLDEGTLRFGNKVEDASGFIILITGNAMQENFSSVEDIRGADKVVERIRKSINQSDVVKYFERLGIDAPKVARFGPIFVNGPLSKNVTEEVSVKELELAVKNAVGELSQMYDVNVDVDSKIVREIVARVTTVRLGMRNVKAAIKTVIVEPLTGILFDLMGTESVKAEIKEGKISWFADGHEVVLTKIPVKGSSAMKRDWALKTAVDKNAVTAVPQIADIEQPAKMKLSPQELNRVAAHEIKGHWMTSYLLEGKNLAERISLIPGDGYLGFVEPKKDLQAYDGTSLNKWLREMIVLEAGHRAVFINGYYSGGGGSGASRKNESAAQDDLGKVEQIFDNVLSNQIFKNFGEYGSAKDKEFFKAYMRHVAKGAADRVIRYGNNTHAFDAIYAEILRERFIDEIQIDALMSKIDRSKLADPDVVLMWSLSQSALAALKRMPKATLLTRELILKTMTEIKSAAKAKRVTVDLRVEKIASEALSRLNGVLDINEPKHATCRKVMEFL